MEIVVSCGNLQEVYKDYNLEKIGETVAGQDRMRICMEL